MKTVVSRSNRYWDIRIDHDPKAVLVTEKWGYAWKCDWDEHGWTTVDQAQFHASAARIIREHWSALLETESSNEELDGGIYSLDFRIERANLNDCHWTVEVHRDPILRSNVNYERRRIQLSVVDVATSSVCTDDKLTCQSGFYTVSHEFGHSLLYGRDEYAKRNRFLGDLSSVMNIGTVVKHRHYTRLLRHINRMVVGLKFRVLVP